MVDSKKLVTSFLLLALMAGSLTFVLAGLLDSKEQAASEDFEIKVGATATNDQNNESAFIETLIQRPETLLQNEESGAELPPAEDPSNLTEDMARKLTQEMAKLNPEEGGLITDKVEIITQDAMASATAISNPQEIAEEIRKTKEELEKESNDFKIIKNYSQEDIGEYITEFNEIVEQNFVQTGLTKLLSQSPSAAIIGSVELALDQTLLKTKSLEVPEALVNFHKSFLELTLYQKKFLFLVQDQIDPIKSGLVFGLQEENYREAIINFSDEFKKAKELDQLSGIKNSNWLVSFFSNTFYPKRAYALFGLGDITFDPANLAEMVFEWGKKILVEKLKKKLVDMIVKQTTNWIQGGGKPKFVQDFPGFIKDATVNTFSSAVANITVPGVLCSRLRPWIEISFQAPEDEESRARKQFKCTVSEAVENIKDFYDDFRAGGIAGYIKVLKPQNNYFGTVIELHDLALAKPAKQAEAEQVKIGSSQGFLGTRVCKNKKQIDFIEVEARLGSLSGNNEADAKAVSKMTGVEYIGPVEMDPDGLKWFNACPSDGWEETTPGKTVAETLDRAIGGHLDWIVNSNDLIALATAFIDSLINKMFQKGTEGLIAVSNTRTTAEDYQASCANYRIGSTAYQDCVRDAQEINAINQSLIVPSSTIKSTAQVYQTVWRQILTSDQEYLAYQPEAVARAQIVYDRNYCSISSDTYGPVSETINKAILEVNTGVIAIQRRVNEASSSLVWLDTFLIKLDEATSSLQLAELNQDLDAKFNGELLISTLDSAQNSSQKVRSLLANMGLVINLASSTPPASPQRINLTCLSFQSAWER